MQRRGSGSERRTKMSKSKKKDKKKVRKRGESHGLDSRQSDDFKPTLERNRKHSIRRWCYGKESGAVRDL